MSFGKGGGSSTVTQNLSPEQQAYVKAQSDFFTNTLAPTYQKAVTGATDVYNQNVGGVTNAAQNLAGTASQAQQVLGSTGESALQTGIGGLEGLFSPQYEQNQLSAAMAPAQMQYQQNLAGQGMQFGGAGQIGSARQALAGQQLAGMTQATQAQTAAGIENQIAQQRLAASQALTGAGQAGIGQALGAAGQAVGAAMTPTQLYNQYLTGVYGTPGSAYTNIGPYGSTTNSSSSNFGIKI